MHSQQLSSVRQTGRQFWCYLTNANQVKEKERAIVCGHRMQNQPLFGFCLALASLLHLLSVSFGPKAGKIYNNLCFLNGQIDIPEVLLTWCYAVMIRCYLNFWAVYYRIWTGISHFFVSHTHFTKLHNRWGGSSCSSCECCGITGSNKKNIH